MADHMKVDYNQLADLESNLTLALNVIGNEWESMFTLRGAVGDERLGQRAMEFRDSWDKNRMDIRDALEYLRDSVKNIHTQLSQVDTDLATGLTAPPASSGGGPNAPKAV